MDTPKKLRSPTKSWTISIHDVIKPNYYISRLTCMWPYVYGNNNKIIDLDGFDNFVSLAFLCGILLYCAFALYCAMIYSFGNAVTAITFAFRVFFEHFLAVGSIVLANYNKNDATKQIFLELHELNQRFIPLKDALPPNVPRALIIRMTVILLICLGIHGLDIGLYLNYLGFDTIVMYISCYIVQLMIFVIFSQIHYKLVILKHHFRSINHKLEAFYEYVADSNGEYKPGYTGELLVAHGKLCNLIKLINAVHGWQIVLMLCVTVALVLNSFNYCVNTVYDKQYANLPKEAVSYLVWKEVLYNIFYWSLVITLSANCSLLQEEAMKSAIIASDILLELPTEPINETEELHRKQLLQFVQQMNARDLHIYGLGMFTFDLTIVSSMIGATTSYFIVILQFQDPAPKTSCGNGTTIQ